MLRRVAIDETAGAVGVSFGGLQAIQAVARLTRSDAGLRRMVGALSRRPVDDWWPTWSGEDIDLARELFNGMGSGAGFVNDLQQARSDRGAYRRAFQAKVRCPTLVTASRDDAGVAFAHAEDFAHTIPTAALVELEAPSHLFWIGPARARLRKPSAPSITATA